MPPHMFPSPKFGSFFVCAVVQDAWREFLFLFFAARPAQLHRPPPLFWCFEALRAIGELRHRSSAHSSWGVGGPRALIYVTYVAVPRCSATRSSSTIDVGRGSTQSSRSSSSFFIAGVSADISARLAHACHWQPMRRQSRRHALATGSMRRLMRSADAVAQQPPAARVQLGLQPRRTARAHLLAED